MLIAHSSFRFQYRLLTMTTFFEIAVYKLIAVNSLNCNNSAICSQRPPSALVARRWPGGKRGAFPRADSV